MAFGTYHRLEIWLNLVCIEITNMRLIEIFASIVHNLVHTGLNCSKNVAFDAHYMHHFTFANFWAKIKVAKGLCTHSGLWLFFIFLVFVVANLVITAQCTFAYIRPKFLIMAKKSQQKCILTLLEQWLLLIIHDLPTFFCLQTICFQLCLAVT